MLKIRLFGTPTITFNGQLLDIRRRATRALLYYLAATGTPVGRDHLAAFFWPELLREEARVRLRDLLGKLRKELPDPNMLKASRQSVGLVFDEIFVDVLAFQELHTNIDRVTWTLSPNLAIPAATYTKMVELVEIWNTPGFITGVDVYVSGEFEDWLLSTERELERAYLDIIRHLYQHERITGNLRLAIHWLHKAVEHVPLNNEINLLLIKTYLEDGQRVEAQKQFEHLQQIWGKDDAQLPDEIEDFRQEVFSQIEDVPAQENHHWLTHPSLSVPYVGQEQVFSQIEASYKRGGTLMIRGEAGAGKTRLAQELYKRISPRPKLLLAACYSHKTEVPFHPWSELLRKYVTQDEWKGLGSFEASMLSILVPEINSWRNDLQAVPDLITAHVRHHLFDAIYQVLLLISQNQPIMLFLDDVHWADESSCELIIYLLNRSIFRQPNHIFLMATRIEEKNQGLAQLLQSHSHHRLEQVYLDHLDLAQTNELACQVLKSELPQEFIERLARKTGGNPYFILETLHEIDYSSDEISFHTALPISDSIHKVIQYRLERLSPDEREVLEIAALLGNHFEIVVAEHVSAYTAERFIHAIDKLHSKRLIAQVHGSKTIQYAFVHENIRETLLQDLPPLKAKLLHRNVAYALTDFAQGKTEAIASILAQHYEAAEEFSQAFDYWVQGASYAYKMTSIKEALKALKHARHLVSVDANLTDEQIYNLYITFTEINFNLDDPTEVEHLNRELLNLGNERESNLLIGVAYKGLSDACLTSNQFEEGLEFTLQAESHLERVENLYEILQTKKRRGILLFMMGRLSEARAILQQSLEQIPEDRATLFANLKSNIHYQLGTVETLMGYPLRGLDYLNRALEQKQKTSTLVEFYAFMGLAYYLKGDFKAGYDVASKAIELGEQLEYKRMSGYAYAYGALNLHYLGLLDEAWIHAEKALEIGQKYGHQEISALAYRTMGHTFMRLKDYPSAIEHFQNGLQAAGEHFVALELMPLLGYTLTETGQIEEGLALLTKSYQTASQLQLGSISVYAHSTLLLAKASHQEFDSAFLEEIELALVDAKSRAMDRAAMILSAPFVRVSQRPGDYVKQVNDVLASISRLPDPLFETRILQRLIEFKQKHGLPWQEDAERMDSTLSKLAPHAVGMPFEDAWQRYVESLQAIQTE